MAKNVRRQSEELEVLKAIFEDKWKQCRVVPDRYTIDIAKDLELSITLNKSYPSDRAPEYDIWAPNLDKRQKHLIDEEFEKIYR
ncbi:hypothetical protein D910_04411 [Dendroctonus ponderosae]